MSVRERTASIKLRGETFDLAEIMALGKDFKSVTDVVNHAVKELYNSRLNAALDKLPEADLELSSISSFSSQEENEEKTNDAAG